MRIFLVLLLLTPSAFAQCIRYEGTITRTVDGWSHNLPMTKTFLVFDQGIEWIVDSVRLCGHNFYLSTSNSDIWILRGGYKNNIETVMNIRFRKGTYTKVNPSELPVGTTVRVSYEPPAKPSVYSNQPNVNKPMKDPSSTRHEY